MLKQAFAGLSGRLTSTTVADGLETGNTHAAVVDWLTGQQRK